MTAAAADAGMELRSANRPLTGGAGAWYDFTDLSRNELAPGQTISLNLNKPLHK